MFVGVAASSVFQNARDVVARRGGDRQRSAATTSPTSSRRAGSSPRRTAGSSASTSAPCCASQRDGGTVDTLNTRRSYFPTQDPSLGPVSRFFEGEATSEVGLRAGLLRDVWTVVSPSLADLRAAHRGGRRGLHAARARSSRRRRSREFLAAALTGLTARYADDPPPANFRFIVSPLVTFVWLGAILIFCGGLVAIWPPPGGAPRAVRAGAGGAGRARAPRLTGDAGSSSCSSCSSSPGWWRRRCGPGAAERAAAAAGVRA